MAARSLVWTVVSSAVTLMLLVAGAAPATAQAVRTTGSLPTLRPGTAVWVATDDGREVKGSVISAQPDALEISTGGESRLLPVDVIRSIRVRPARTRYVIIGTAAGFAAGLFIEHTVRPPDDPRTHVIGPLVGSSAGAGVGLLLARGPRFVYAAPAAPAPGPAGGGAAAQATRHGAGNSGWIWGLVIGGGGGVAAGFALAAASDGTHGSGTVIGVGAGGALAGAAIGYLISSSRAAASPKQAPARDVAVVPQISRSGFSVTLHFSVR